MAWRNVALPVVLDCGQVGRECCEVLIAHPDGFVLPPGVLIDDVAAGGGPALDSIDARPVADNCAAGAALAGAARAVGQAAQQLQSGAVRVGDAEVLAAKVLLAELPQRATSCFAGRVWAQGVVICAGVGFIDLDDGTAVVSIDVSFASVHALGALEVGNYVSCICNVVGDMDLRLESACRLDGPLSEPFWWLEVAQHRASRRSIERGSVA